MKTKTIIPNKHDRNVTTFFEIVTVTIAFFTLNTFEIFLSNIKYYSS